MNIISMPGFTAEASLYRAKVHCYHTNETCKEAKMDIYPAIHQVLDNDVKILIDNAESVRNCRLVKNCQYVPTNYELTCGHTSEPMNLFGRCIHLGFFGCYSCPTMVLEVNCQQYWDCSPRP